MITSKSVSNVLVVGILNVTPDSFSDGGHFLDPSSAIDGALKLLDEGADIIEVGGDSTRPQSKCVGIEEEWKRIEPILAQLSKKTTLMVDTHHAEVARRSIELGVQFINDISAGSDKSMFDVVKKGNVRYVAMFLPSGQPHSFGDGISPFNCLDQVNEGLQLILSKLEASGIDHKKVILDTGMGAFLSSDPSTSWRILSNYERFFELKTPLLLGCSRKGFLRSNGNDKPEERDSLSALCGALIASKWARDNNHNSELFIRVHNARLQKQFLSTINQVWSKNGV